MQHFPIFIDLDDQKVVVSGVGETAVSKLRLLLKTNANIDVYGAEPVEQVISWASEERLRLFDRALEVADCHGARLILAANNDRNEDKRVAMLGREANALVNIVDSLQDSDFITPAIVDRDPVVIAIGTEGAAPVLARRIKAQLEESLPPEIGVLARIAKQYRGLARIISSPRERRHMWLSFFENIGPRALKRGGEENVRKSLDDLIRNRVSDSDGPGKVSIIGAGPGDPELLTLKARKLLDTADVVIHDRLVTLNIIELARREAVIVEVGKNPRGNSWAQDDINALMIRHALSGAKVVRIKSGDPTVYGRLDEELDALDEAGISYDVVPGITAASAAAAQINASLTQRRRNSEFRILTGHDVDGFAEQDWRNLAQAGTVAAIYMGVSAARFLQGRLMLHGADRALPMTVVENVSRPNQKIVSTTLGELEDGMTSAAINGPAIIFLGLQPRAATAAIETLEPEFREAL